MPRKLRFTPFSMDRSISLSSVRVLAIVVVVASATIAPAEDWPGWRGPRGDGSSLEPVVPLRWSGTENVAWKVEVPGAGHASPIVWGDDLFLVTCLGPQTAAGATAEGAPTAPPTSPRQLLCYDRKSGALRWQQTVLESPLEEKHTLNSFASSTPATDGERVYASFLDGADMVVAALDLSGKQLWVVRPGIFASKHGYCSSPVIYEDLVIVNGDHDGESYLVALARSTGETVWKVPRENKLRSYCTPIIREINGQPQLILSGSRSVTSFNPRDGSRHWFINGPTEQFVASIVYNGDLLFMTCGFPEHHMLAIRPDGHGNVTDTHIAWRTTENASYVPSPIAIGDYFLVVSDAGIASCFEASSGRRTWRKRIGRRYSASLVSAAGLAYFLSDDGVATIIRPGEAYDEVAINELGEACFASPAISGSQLFLRGERHLYCIGDGGSQAADAGGD